MSHSQFDDPFIMEKFLELLQQDCQDRHNDRCSDLRYKERIAIVGAGPAGLSAAAVLSHWGYSVTIFEATSIPGGMLALGIPEFRLPRTVLSRALEALFQPGIRVYYNTTLGQDVSLEDLQNSFDVSLIAAGAQKSQPVGIPGEAELPDVFPALTFLKEWHLGRCRKLEGDVAVIGNGIALVDAARAARRAGARSVHIFHSGRQSDLANSSTELHAAQQEGIVFQELVLPSQGVFWEQRI